MTTALVTHPACLGHETPAGHPESPERLRAVLGGLAGLPLRALGAPAAESGHLLRVHAPELLQAILEEAPRMLEESHSVQIDADTYMSAGSAEAALRAAGAVVAAVDSVLSGKARNAFCAIRPPGHHAERMRAMGFCLFNSIAVGALHARAAHGLKRIAVIDFDVHHGNGSQDIFFNDADAFYASTHQMPLYPGTGYQTERGVAENMLNRPLRSGTGSTEFRAIYTHSILPALEGFEPEFIFISAGFDAHRADPLAGLNLNEDDFAWVTCEICRIASRVCGGRVVSALEGGYDLAALAASVRAHVGALLEA